MSNVLVREHNNNEVIRLMVEWWNELEKGSRRDQLSFNYVCWKKRYVYDISELKCWKSEYWSNPGIHTSDIRVVEDEVIKHIQFADDIIRQLIQKDEYIRIKEQELKDARTYIGWKEQELKDANTLIGWKEQELKDARTYIGWKEQELKDANTQLQWKDQCIADLQGRYDRTITRRIKRLFKKKTEE